MHLQKPINDWTDGLIPGLDQVVKFVDNVQALKDAKLVNPRCKTILRHWYDPGQVFGGTWDENVARARKFFATFIDDTFREYAQYVDFVEEWNEYLANSQTIDEINQRVRWAEAAAVVWDLDYRTQLDYGHIRLVLCNTAIGNDIDAKFAIVALTNDAVLGYHPYTHYQHGKRNPADWRWLSGRWNFMEKEWGLKPTWAFTEAGPYEAAETGWRASECLGGNREAYVEAMRQWYLDVKCTDAYNEGRIVGADYPAAVFNSGSGGHGAWKTFENGRDELVALSEMFEAERDAPPVEPPVVEPLPYEYDMMTPVYGGRLNVRKGPGIEYAIVGGFGSGTQLTPDGYIVIDADNVWLRFGTVGWSAELHNGYTYLREVGTHRAPENDPNER